MDYTLGTLKGILKKRLQDEEFDEDALTLFLNQAQSEILGEDKYPFMQKIDRYQALPEGELSLPFAYAGTFHIFANKDGEPRQELHYISPEEFFNNTQAHTMVWTKYGDSIFYRLYISTEKNKCPFSFDGFEILHLYLIEPKPLAKDTDKSPIPAQYIEALVLGALSRCEQLRDNFDYAQIYRNQQDQILTNMKLRYGPGNLSADNRAKLPYFGGYADERI